MEYVEIQNIIRIYSSTTNDTSEKRITVEYILENIEQNDKNTKRQETHVVDFTISRNL